LVQLRTADSEVEQKAIHGKLILEELFGISEASVDASETISEPKETLSGGIQGCRIPVDAQDEPVGLRGPKNGLCVASAAHGAVDDGLPRSGAEELDALGE
jgi:hypothetical protein